MTDNNPTGSAASGDKATASQKAEPEASQSDEDPGYLTETGEAAGDDGSVVPIIGGLPAAEGSAWDIGAPEDERGAGLAEELGNPPGQACHEDTPRS